MAVYPLDHAHMHTHFCTLTCMHACTHTNTHAHSTHKLLFKTLMTETVLAIAPESRPWPIVMDSRQLLHGHLITITSNRKFQYFPTLMDRPINIITNLLSFVL